MKNEEYNEDTFKLTTIILQWNPDYYTIWNYRRILILDQVSEESVEIEQKQKTFINELLLFLQLIKINPKSYWLWNHRIWCLQTMPKPDWNAELGLVDRMLTMDARNCK
jgi:geranylgeranyl transferase type-2 subunit alpha